MDESNINWVLAIASLLAGIGIGALGYHLLNASAGNLQKLRQRLAERDRELAALKDGVDDHFAAITGLVENLRREGDALAQRLEHDAQALGGHSPGRTGLELPLQVGENAANETYAAPRDYADGTGGTLAEDFGLKSEEGGAPQPPRY
ncbi:YhcB family protein [Halomonas sp. C05BenzN]|uniref:YhcB family protein n=1 Tax=Halomonas sp. C05BenzN TaxID=3411041 RepID=UPI003B925E3D